VQALKNLDSAMSYQPGADTPSSREEALGSSRPADHRDGSPPAGKGPTWTADPHSVQFPRKVEQLRKIEPVLKKLYQELFDHDRKDEADAVFVALVWLQTTLVAEE
jgi:hypothetical protein